MPAPCYNCRKEAELKYLKRCGACRSVTYCSKDCQKAHWKLIHKYNCFSAPVPSKEEAPAFKSRGKIITAWQDVWRTELDLLSLAALDIPKNPGKNSTHCMFIHFDYTGREAVDERFEIVGGSVCPTDDVLARAPQLNLMRDAPTLAGKEVRYAMVFNFNKEKGAPAQTFIRARALSLPENIEFLKSGPRGWAGVYPVLASLFRPVEREKNHYVAVEVPVDE